jgi:periplasmic copper chaperone A
MKTIAIAAALIVAGAGAALAQNERIGSIEIGGPWAAATGSRPGNSAVYLSLTDLGTQSDELVGATSPIAQKVELHVFSVVDGVYGMHKVEGIEIAPGPAATVLRPGGAHIMLESLKRPLRPGTTFPVTLYFQRAGQLQIDVLVESREAAIANAKY